MNILYKYVHHIYFRHFISLSHSLSLFLISPFLFVVNLIFILFYDTDSLKKAFYWKSLYGGIFDFDLNMTSCSIYLPIKHLLLWSISTNCKKQEIGKPVMNANYHQNVTETLPHLRSAFPACLLKHEIG